MKVISEINGSGLYAQSALSASTASYDSLGNEITATYATKSEIPSLDGLMETDKLEFDSNNKITAYNGSAFAGQSSTSDLVYFDYEDGTPELTWNEIQAYMDAGKQLIIYDRNAVSDGKTKFGYVSNYNKADKFIQFNNVGNTTSGTTPITGINWAYLGNSLGWQRTGAQGGGGFAEVVTSEPITGNGTTESPIGADTVDVNYQEITHDDSLVHVSNNAQYALGVNVPYMKWLMGVDTKDLWTGTLNALNTEITLNDDITNYDKIEFWFGGGNDTKLIVTIIPVANERVCFVHGGGVTATHISWIVGIFDDRVFKFTAGRDYNFGTSTTWATPTITNGLYSGNFTLTKIKGVHRKEWNGGI